MGRPKKNFYANDLGSSLKEKMRVLDWEDRQDLGVVDNGNVYLPYRSAPSDQEDEDWLERLYER